MTNRARRSRSTLSEALWMEERKTKVFPQVGADLRAASGLVRRLSGTNRARRSRSTLSEALVVTGGLPVGAQVVVIQKSQC